MTPGMVMVVPLRLSPMGDIERGGWCDVCALPSVLSQVWLVSTARATLGRRVATLCTECDHHEWRPL